MECTANLWYVAFLPAIIQGLPRKGRGGKSGGYMFSDLNNIYYRIWSFFPDHIHYGEFPANRTFNQIVENELIPKRNDLIN